MNACKKFEEDISAYLDKELALTRQKEVEEHLQVCQECQKKLKEFEEVWGLLDEYQTIPDICTPVSKFYIQTLPSYLLGKKNFALPFFKYRVFPYASIILAGILFGVLLFCFFFYDFSDFNEEIWENREILSHPDFEIIANLEILENYEVWKYFTPEMLYKWKKNQEKNEFFKNIKENF